VALVVFGIFMAMRRRGRLVPVLGHGDDLLTHSLVDICNPAPPVALICSSSVGKTSLVNRITGNRFLSITAPTTGAAFHVCRPIADFPEVQLWDTPGMDRYRSQNAAFYREAIGAIIVFDLTSYSSFRELETWVSEFIGAARPNPAVVICGNKADLQDSREVENDEIVAFCNIHNGIPYFEVSAYTGEGISQMMSSILRMIPTDLVVGTGAASRTAERRCW
jgi:small GTP-binding protein